MSDHTKINRGTLARMAGNIAAGMVSAKDGAAYVLSDSELGTQARRNIAIYAVEVAKNITKCIEADEEEA